MPKIPLPLSSKGKTKTAVDPEIALQHKRERTAQQWLPIVDIENTIVYRKDNTLLGMLRIQPQNLGLLSEKEQERKVESLTEKLNGEKEGQQIFCIGRPVDLNSYLDWLQEKAKTAQDFTRKMVLKGYIHQASELAAAGDTTERRFYIIVTTLSAPKAEENLKARLTDLQTKYTQADLTAEICHDDELLDVYSLFANPVQASFERSEFQFDLAPILDIEFGGTINGYQES